MALQYAARLNADKLKGFVYRLNKGSVSNKYFNMRLAPEAVSDQLSGFSHNAVTPIGMASEVPIILSHRIVDLSPDFFWMGGGEVDLKVGLRTGDFLRAYNPIVADCTYD